MDADGLSEAALLRLWGKTKDRKPNATIYHPLLYHSLDVGNSALVLWRLLPIRMRERIRVALGVATIDEAERAVVLIAGLHDLGKASAFQTKAPLLWNMASRILPLKTPRHGWENEKLTLHAWITAQREFLPNLLLNSDAVTITSPHRRLVNALASITAAHHGKFPPPGLNVDVEQRGAGAWDAARFKLARLLAHALYADRKKGNLPGTIELTRSQLDDVGVGAYLTGLIAVADWIGSSSSFFLLDSQMRPVQEYRTLSRRRARSAIWSFGWYPPKKIASPLPFRAIVWDRDEEDRPVRFENPMQAMTERFARSAGDRPYLLIIEAAMGDGKTEAALYAADYGMAAHGRPGFYVALPTQATGNAMLRRVNTYLSERGHQGKLNIQLVHGGRDFNPDFEALRRSADQAREPKANANGPDQEIDGEDDSMRLVAERWFSHSKQGLLAPFGVGTIDQTLMGVLQTKHWFVRLFGLADKTVIFDEIHSYDLYAISLLETLIAWLAEMGCTVVLLSATLPRERREALIRAYRPDAEVNTADYPRITFVPRAGEDADCVHIPDDPAKPLDEKERMVQLCWAEPNPAELPARIARDLPHGGCAAIIANTVAQAIAYYEAFVSSELVRTAGWNVTLLHARMPLLWRQEREAEVLARFGKTSQPIKRDKQILISTQIIEQSLNIDFDWMASEFAPIDLMLQRIGRLWRHARRTRTGQRPADVARFIALVGQEPNATDPLPIFAPNSDVVYDEYILLRSFLAARHKVSFEIPRDIEPLVNAVYDGEAVPPDPRWRDCLEEAKRRMGKKNERLESAAKMNQIPLPASGGDFRSTIAEARLNLLEEDDPATPETLRASTRFGDPSILLICLRQDADGNLRPFCHGDPGGVVSLEDEPADDLVRAMRESAVSVARPKKLFYALLHQPVPKAWKENAHLRYARHAVFTDGHAQVATKTGVLTLNLTKETGLLIVNEQAIKEPNSE